MTGQYDPDDKMYEDSTIASMTVGVRLHDVMAYEFRKYARTMQYTHAELARRAIEEYLTKRGVTLK